MYALHTATFPKFERRTEVLCVHVLACIIVSVLLGTTFGTTNSFTCVRVGE